MIELEGLQATDRSAVSHSRIARPLMWTAPNGSRRAQIRGHGARPIIMRFLRRVHAIIGIVSTLNILLMITTGFMIQHRDDLGLENRYVSRRFLPDSYRPSDVDLGVRGDIVVTDLHSGRLIGKKGALILDALTFSWLMLVITGVVMFVVRNGKPGKKNNGAEP